ncbi:MAG TPA: hypothetical protein VJT84_05110 [Gaiellaceae bacterium]|nr:hypothetical protein [Gaiellaceae bacterium]
MDRDALGRALRRRQVQDALDAERDRERSLQEEIEAIVGEAEGPRIDHELFATMAPEEVEIVRGVVQPPEFEVDEEWLGAPLEDEPADAEDDTEAELARLQEEIADSRRHQAAFERYLAALDQAPEPGAAGNGD